MQLNVSYNKKALIGSIGPSAWAKLGPEDWFENYRMILANARDYQADFVINLDLPFDPQENFSTQRVVEEPVFQETVRGLEGYKFIVYKPIDVPAGLDPNMFITNDVSYRRFEDKKVFREIFGGKVPIAEHVIEPAEALDESNYQEFHARHSERFGETYVVQDNIIGGGRGTFFVRSAEDAQRAASLLNEERKGTYNIVSRYIHGYERSIQAFVSAGQTLLGPVQQQLLRNGELQNPHGRGGMYFCGGRFVQDDDEAVTSKIKEYTQAIAEVLRAEGYRGIFGVDFMVAKDNMVYVIEVNARTTGILPLLNEQKVATPLYLLHILELAHMEYSIEGSVDNAYTELNGPLSFVTLFNKSDELARLDDAMTTGNYTFTDGVLRKVSDSPRWQEGSDFVIQQFVSDGYPAKPNVKLCNIFLRHEGFDTQGELTENTREIVNEVKRHIIT